MKNLFIFALMTMAASSSFAIDNTLQCANSSVNVVTSRYMNDKNLHMMAQFFGEDGTFQSVVKSESSFLGGPKSFIGKTTDGRSIKLVVKKDNGLKGTLTIDGVGKVKDLTCRELGLFEM